MRALLSFLCFGVGTLAAQPNIIFFPPAADAKNKLSNFAVTAGDTLNITWSTTYDSVDLRILATASGSNFTVTRFFNPSLDQTSFFAYILQPHDYYINETATPIEAYFQVADHQDNTLFVRSQNFSIFQPQNDVQLDASGIPGDASTWAGSVTLFSSEGTLVPSTIIQARVTAPPMSTSTTPTLSLVTPDSTAASSSPASQPESGGAWLGVGLGVALAVLVLLGLLGGAGYIARRKRRRREDAKKLQEPRLDVDGSYSKLTPRASSASDQMNELGDGKIVREMDSRSIQPVIWGELPGSDPEMAEAPGDTVGQSRWSRKGSPFEAP